MQAIVVSILCFLISSSLFAADQSITGQLACAKCTCMISTRCGPALIQKDKNGKTQLYKINGNGAWPITHRSYCKPGTKINVTVFGKVGWDGRALWKNLNSSAIKREEDKALGKPKSPSENNKGKKAKRLPADIPELEALARKGDVDAQLQLAVEYRIGKLVGRDLDASLKWVEKAVAQGSARGLFHLGIHHKYGLGISKNQQKAEELYLRAGKGLLKESENGNPLSQYRLGLSYLGGTGMEKDADKALKWTKESAENGYISAQFTLGHLIQSGRVVGERSKLWKEEGFDGAQPGSPLFEAMDWYHLAADQGHSEAMYRLGLIYEKKIENVKPNKSEALKWYDKSASLGNVNAKNRVREFQRLAEFNNDSLEVKEAIRAIADLQKAKAAVLNSRSDEKKASAKAVLQRQKEEFAALKELADKGDSKAQSRLADAYYYGIGTAVNYLKAVKWATKSATQGNPNAQYRLGVIYKYSLRDNKLSEEWLKKSVEKMKREAAAGNAVAQANYGVMLLRGYGMAKDGDSSAKWIRKSADNNYPRAMRVMGTLYLNGEGVGKNFIEAMKWWHKAAEIGDAVAMYNIGSAYFSGEATKKDVNEAFVWFQKAAMFGHLGSTEMISRLYNYSDLKVEDAVRKEKYWYWLQKFNEQERSQMATMWPLLLEQSKEKMAQLKATARQRVKDIAALKTLGDRGNIQALIHAKKKINEMSSPLEITVPEPGYCHQAHWSPDGLMIALDIERRKRNEVEIWSVAENLKILSLNDYPNNILTVSWSPDGKKLAGTVWLSGRRTRQYGIKIWDTTTWKEIKMLNGFRGEWVRQPSIAWHPSGDKIATCNNGSGDSNNVKIWDVSTGKVIRQIESGQTHQKNPRGGQNIWVVELAWDQSGEKLAGSFQGSYSGSNKLGNITIWDANLGQELFKIRSGINTFRIGGIQDIAWNPVGKKIAGIHKGGVKVWNSSNGKLIHDIKLEDHGESEGGSVAWSPDGEKLAAGTNSKSLIYDASNAKLLLAFETGGTLKDHNYNKLAWSGDGAMIARGGVRTRNYPIAKAWDVAAMLASPYTGASPKTNIDSRWRQLQFTLLGKKPSGRVLFVPVKGISLGMNFVKAVESLDKRYPELKLKKWEGLTLEPSEDGKSVKTARLDKGGIQLFAGADGQIKKISFSRKACDKLFGVKGLSNEKFTSGFAQAYKVRGLRSFSETKPVGLTDLIISVSGMRYENSEEGFRVKITYRKTHKDTGGNSAGLAGLLNLTQDDIQGFVTIESTNKSSFD